MASITKCPFVNFQVEGETCEVRESNEVGSPRISVVTTKCPLPKSRVCAHYADPQLYTRVSFGVSVVAASKGRLYGAAIGDFGQSPFS